MIDYLTLKNSYIATIQIGLQMNTEYEETKRGNTILHKLCEICVDNSNYSELNKQNMKRELELIKETLSQEIELRYHSTQ